MTFVYKFISDSSVTREGVLRQAGGLPTPVGTVVQIKTKSTFSSPYRRGAAVLEAVPKTTDAVRGQKSKI